MAVRRIGGCCCRIIGFKLKCKKKPEGWGAMRYPQLVLGMLGILFM
jgi:hypothetical protein